MPCIEVDKEDIRLANDLANQILGHSLDELSRPGYELLLLLEQASPVPNQAKPGPTPASPGKAEPGRPSVATFTRRQIREFTGWSQSRVHRYLKELIDLEYVLVESGRNGTLQTYRLCYRGEGKDGQKFMLGLKPIEELTDPPA